MCRACCWCDRRARKTGDCGARCSGRVAGAAGAPVRDGRIGAGGAGGALGLGCAYGAMQVLMRLIPKDMLAHMPYLGGIGLNAHVVAFAWLISLLAAVLFALTPVLRLPLAAVAGRLGGWRPKICGNVLAAVWREPGGAGAGDRRGAAGGRGSAGARVSTSCCMWSSVSSLTIWRRCRSWCRRLRMAKTRRRSRSSRQILARVCESARREIGGLTRRCR